MTLVRACLVCGRLVNEELQLVPTEPSILWVDPGAGLGGTEDRPIMLRYPDGSIARGRVALIAGASELRYYPDVEPGPVQGLHVVLETHADVELDP